MNYILPLSLVVGVALLICLIIVGYIMYANTQRKTSMTNMFAQKESEILELYNSLEKMMEEMDRFVYQSKIELQEEKNKILELYGRMPIAEDFNQSQNVTKTVSETRSFSEKISMPETRSISYEVGELNSIRNYSENTPYKQPERIVEEPIKEPVRTELSEREKLMQKVANKRDSKGGKVITLYRQGVSVQNIAKMMSMGHGEVQLLIDLKNKYQ